MTAIRFHPEAALEFEREVEFYTQVRTGAGIRFHAAVEHAVSRAAARPLSGAPSFKETRGMRVKGFPFNIIYRATSSTIEIVAVSPHRKRPGYRATRIE